MSEAAVDWLPDSSFSSPALAAAIQTVVDAWAGRWFGVRAPEAQGAARAGMERRLAPGKVWRCLAEGIWLEWSEPTRLAYAQLALDQTPRDRSVAAADKQLLLLLSDRLAEELGKDLSLILHAKPATSLGGRVPTRGLLMAWHGKTGIPALELTIAHRALAALRRQQCPPWRATSAPRSTLTEALGDVQVEVEAVLGRAELSAFDLCGIATGDVVVIKRKSDEALELQRAGSECVLAHAVLTREHGELVLKARTQ